MLLRWCYIVLGGIWFLLATGFLRVWTTWYFQPGVAVGQRTDLWNAIRETVRSPNSPGTRELLSLHQGNLVTLLFVLVFGGVCGGLVHLWVRRWQDK